MANKTSPISQLIGTIRSIIISRKDPTTVQDLIREYQELEGENISYRKHGFDTIERLLESTKEFTIRRVGNNTIITVLNDNNTKHLTKMLQLQKSAKRRNNGMQRKPRVSDMSFYTRPRTTSAISPKKTFNNYLKENIGGSRMQNNNQQKTNNNYINQNRIQTKSPPIKPLLEILIPKETISRLQVSQQSNRNKQPTIQQQQQQQANSVPRPISKNNSVRELVQLTQKIEISKQNNVQKTSGPQLRAISRSNSHELRSITKSNSHELNQQVEPTNQFKSEKPIAQNSIPYVNNTPKLRPLSRSNSNEMNPSAIQLELANDNNSVMKKSVQNRLQIRSYKIPENEIYQPEHPKNLEITVTVNRDSNNKNPVQDTMRTIKQSDFIGQRIEERIKTPSTIQLPQNTMEELAYYCINNKLAKPLYSSFYFHSTRGFQATVAVNTVAYKTYPDDFPTEKEAYLKVSSIALEQLKKIEIKQRYPICLDSDIKIAIKIHKQVVLSPNGLFRSCIPERFLATYEQQLPDNWFSIIRKYSQLFTIEELCNKFIIFANDAMIKNNSDCENGLTEKLQFPWSEKHWNLNITNPMSTVSIWARIVGTNYSEIMESLTTDIELAMLTDNMVSPTVLCDHIYLTKLSECWYRIRTEEIQEDSCLCFFVDVGESEWISINDIYICDKKFLQLPFQAIRFSLFGLEDFAEHPQAKNYLEELLAGKAFVGEIVITKEEYEKQEESENLEPRLQVILFDTASDEDIDLNNLILKAMTQLNPSPQFNHGDVTHVNVTHICDNGDIYCQIINANLDYVHKLINTLISSNELIEEQKKLMALEKKLNDKIIFLIFDDNDRKWYRAIIETVQNNNTYRMFCIDYGMERICKLPNMFYLDKLCIALNHYPGQAIKIQLIDVEISDKVVSRMKGLLLFNEAMVKVKRLGDVPQVLIYTRIEEKQILLPINEIIKHETEMEKTASSIWPEKRVSPINGESNELPRKKINSDNNNIKPLKNVNLPLIGHYFEVFITMASNPNNFIVRPHSDGPALHTLMTELQKYCKFNNDCLNIDDIIIGQYYAALHEDDCWYRVKVVNKFDTSMIHICYCDYGDITVVGTDKLKTLPQQFRELPKQAIKAKLHGIIPKYVDWSMEDCTHFQKLTVKKTFFSLVNSIKNDELCPNDCIIELHLIDTSGPVDVFIHQKLIDENRAICDDKESKLI